MADPVNLPALTSGSLALIDEITDSLGVPRDVIAPTEDISRAWQELPALLLGIPVEYRNELLARMCVAVRVGLFDSSLNYIWNLAISAIKQKIVHFGLPIAASMLSKDIDERWLDGRQDSEILSLALSLNLLDEDGYFKLDHCRDMRNNFSAAHPPIGNISVYDLFSFVDRCVKYAISSGNISRGVDVKLLLNSIKAGKYTPVQLDEWAARIRGTNGSQRSSIVEMLHGIYCDENTQEEARVNVLGVLRAIKDAIPASAISGVVARHQDYVAAGNEKKQKASYRLLEESGWLRFLPSSSLHTLVSSACESLYNVHLAMNNFFNESSFAQRLMQIVTETPVPDLSKPLFVETVMTCAVGNAYGTAFSAEHYYTSMIRNFSPAEIDIMFDIAEGRKASRFALRLQNYPRCKKKFREYLSGISPDSMSPKAQTAYRKWMAE